MNKFFLVGLFLFSFSVMADTPSFIGNFKGFYFGPALGFGRTQMGVSNQRYKGNEFMIGGLFGYGKIFDSDLYGGVEAGWFHHTFSQTRQFQSVEKKNHIEGIFRFGQIIQNNFLPYVGLGGAYSDYRMQSTSQNQGFHTTDLVSEIGVDAFVRPHITIRSAVRYQMGLSKPRRSTLVDVQKKSRSLFLKIGISYIL